MLGCVFLSEWAKHSHGRRAISLVSRFLVTTALEETWPTSEPVLFLGEWCRRFSRRHLWQGLDAEIVPYHWDDRQQLKSDYYYIQDFYERVLLDLSRCLNEQHDVDYSLRYWRIRVGPWLGFFIAVLFDRWTSVTRAVQQFDVSGTAVVRGLDVESPPNDFDEFQKYAVADDWNHFVYSKMLAALGCIRIFEKSAQQSQGVVEVAVSPPRRADAPSLRKRVTQTYSRLASVFARDSDAFFYKTYLSTWDELKLQVRLGQVPQFWKQQGYQRIPIVKSAREWILRGESRTEFERLARSLIPLQIPAVYLEGFAHVAERAVAMGAPQAPRVIWTSNAHLSDEVFKSWAAEQVDSGTPLIIGQHGGHYGIGDWSFFEDHDVAICNRYLTWGWRDSNPKVTPVGQLKRVKSAREMSGAKNDLLVVSCIVPRYSYWLSSIIVAGQYLGYLEDQFEFARLLPHSLQVLLKVRLYPQDLGWDQAARWDASMPEIRLDPGHEPIADAMSASRLCVCTYNATTFLESFAMDIPTVIFWNPEHWELRESAVPYFAELERVGIFHTSPQSAAQHIAAIWDHVEAWWAGDEVQEVLSRFKSNYCDAGPEMPTRLRRALRNPVPLQQE